MKPVLLPILAALPAVLDARKYAGTATGDTWPFLAKFAFGVDKNGGPVGTIKFSWTYPQGAPQAGLYLYDDNQWASAYPGSGCAGALPQANQGSMVPLSTDPTFSPLTTTVTEAVSPHFWFFTLAVAPDCSQGVQLGWALELTQADGSQLSYDEVGLPAAYGVFWAALTALLAAHVWAHYLRSDIFSPLIVRWLTASLALSSLCWFSRMVDVATAASSGSGVPFFAVVGEVCRLLGLMTLWVLCALAANGVGIVTRGVSEKNYNWVGYALLGGLLASYVALAVYYSVDVDPRLVVSFGSMWPAITLLLMTFGFAGWWVWKTRGTILSEVSTVKKAALLRIALALAVNFFILPFALLVGAATPAYMRLRIVAGIDVFLVSAVYAALVWVLWPSRAGDAFRSYGDAASLAGMLGLDDGLSLDPMLAGQLSEAYAYAPAPEMKNYAV